MYIFHCCNDLKLLAKRFYIHSYTDIQRVNMSLQPAIKNSKKKRKVMVEDLIGESSQAVKIEGRDTTDKMTNTDDDDGKSATATPTPTPTPAKKQRRKRFISLKEFDKLAQDPPVEWCALQRDCIYKLVDLDKLVGRVLANLTDQKGRLYRAFIPSIVLQTLHDKLASESSKDTPVEIYIRPKDDKEADIAIKETFSCQHDDCGEEFHSNTGRYLHQKCCMKKEQHNIE